ncbi:LYAR protein, partial [Corythaeola cristata]|nr:LYAR protein [Corythaeola cristata]
MVVFTCNACGESVKKAQVEKHVNICRNCQCLSCMDCGKDFWGDDYKEHVKCVSEDQKYGGKDFEAKTNKGDAKQQEWIQKIHEVMKKPNISPKVRNILEQMRAFDNIPRKKVKFQNWMKNSLRITDSTLQEQVWDIFSETTRNVIHKERENTIFGVQLQEAIKTPLFSELYWPQINMYWSRKLTASSLPILLVERDEIFQLVVQIPPTDVFSRCLILSYFSTININSCYKNRNFKSCQNFSSFTIFYVYVYPIPSLEEPHIKTKRMKTANVSEDMETENTNGNEENVGTDKGKFNWKGTIKAVLKQAPDNEISIKKLRKKVIAQYYAVAGEHHKSEEDILVIFNKKVNNNPKFKVLKDKVKLLK